MRVLKLNTPLNQIRGIGPAVTAKLNKLGLNTVNDILYHFPFRYEDFSHVSNIADLVPKEQSTIHGVIEDVSVRRAWHRRMFITEAQIADETGTIRAVWFNQPYIKNILIAGQMANFAGKVSESEEGELYLSNPTFEVLKNENQETKHTARLVPIYPETRGFTSKGIRAILNSLLQNIPRLYDWIPKDILEKNSLPDLKNALQKIHYPETLNEAFYARKRFAFEDLYLLQLFNLIQKLTLAEEKSPKIPTDIEWLKNEVLSKLPFELTDGQKKSLWEIIKDIGEEKPMNRLIQGDVGSGKTAVAAVAALIAAKAGLQTAIMAPTEVLAKQHYETFKKLFLPMDKKIQPQIGLVTASEAKIFYEKDVEADTKKTSLIQKVKKGEIPIIIGTHALISGTAKNAFSFHNLGILIIDEQHRFGVKQRAELTKNSKGIIPHFLSMSATPIPRTLMLSVFGDLDISVISELPKGRQEITTQVVQKENTTDAYNFIKQKLNEGRQAFVVCPRIEPSEEEKTAPKKQLFQNIKKLELKSVKEEYEKLSKTVFKDYKVAMLHGQMKPAEKEKIMADFKANKINVLVSTTVIEVGVDIPNAVVMVIEGSERFGLAQLHQLRGRIGRGEHKSYCYLFTDSKNPETNARLKAIIEAKNGFELAEKDLEIRGPGQFIGEEQSGFSDFMMKSLQNIELVKSARESAALTLTKSRNLEKFPNLKERFDEFKIRLHLE